MECEINGQEVSIQTVTLATQPQVHKCNGAINSMLLYNRPHYIQHYTFTHAVSAMKRQTFKYWYCTCLSDQQRRRLYTGAEV